MKKNRTLLISLCSLFIYQIATPSLIRDFYRGAALLNKEFNEEEVAIIKEACKNFLDVTKDTQLTPNQKTDYLLNTYLPAITSVHEKRVEKQYRQTINCCKILATALFLSAISTTALTNYSTAKIEEQPEDPSPACCSWDHCCPKFYQKEKECLHWFEHPKSRQYCNPCCNSRRQRAQPCDQKTTELEQKNCKAIPISYKAGLINDYVFCTGRHLAGEVNSRKIDQHQVELNDLTARITHNSISDDIAHEEECDLLTPPISDEGVHGRRNIAFLRENWGSEPGENLFEESQINPKRYPQHCLVIKKEAQDRHHILTENIPAEKAQAEIRWAQLLGTNNDYAHDEPAAVCPKPFVAEFKSNHQNFLNHYDRCIKLQKHFAKQRTSRAVTIHQPAKQKAAWHQRFPKECPR